ncbi:MAG: transposase [Gammaproteobacteria bacterium]|nr:transposase [Gammaproteobacteria bacterium]
MVFPYNGDITLPRPIRLNLPGIPQHVTQRGNNRNSCFFSNADYQLYLDLLAKSCEKHDCSLHAYVLMTNHVHFLMTPKVADGVSLVIRDVGRDYVRTVNKKYGRTGTMWEGRFKSSPVDSDFYCLACYRYIELNPVRAGIVERPENYRWSSYRFNALNVQCAHVVPHETWNLLGQSETDRKHAYRKLFETELDQNKLEEIRYGVRKGLPIGNRNFRQEIESTLSIAIGSGKRGRPRKSERK